ncbi:MAG: bacteriohopanetetrol glucosamine biosynthesis glycosyltransferase HpnI [Bryobacteraceae bacterium]
MLTVTALAVLVGCWVYCILAIAAALRHARIPATGEVSTSAAISILKPLSGLDEGLEENLRSFFEQDYATFELLFAVRQENDPAVPIVRRLIAEYPSVPAKLILTGEPPYPHAKVYSLQCMLDRSRHDLVVMSDSDVRVDLDFCRKLAAEFSDQNLGLVTCPYRAVSGKAIWSRLEAVGMNTDFHAGLFTAVMMEGTKFAVGPTIVARKSVLLALGGMERVKDYLAEDYMLGRIAAELGFVVRLSPYVVEHRIGSEGMLKNFSHRLRWARSTRRSRPWGYVGQFFTHPLPVGLTTALVCPEVWPFMVVTLALRVVSAWTVSQGILRARVPWLLLPLQDMLGFVFWVAGFFGNSINWRGQRYILNRDGTVQPAN